MPEVGKTIADSRNANRRHTTERFIKNIAILLIAENLILASAKDKSTGENMIETAEYTLDKVEEVWRKWRGDINSWRSQTAMVEIDKILCSSEKELLEDQGCVGRSKT